MSARWAGLLIVVWTVLGAARAAHAAAPSLGPSVLRAPVTEKVAEQGILTPVPVRVELPEELAPRRVLVHYRLFGSPEWTTLELAPSSGSLWVGLIPCLEVSTVTGDLVYYVRAHDADGAVVAFSGSRHEPYRVRIVYAPSAEAEPRQRCPDPADCPAGLPGCPSEKVQRVPCSADDDCEQGMSCGWDAFCERSTRRRTWLGVDVEQDFGLVSTRGACNVSSQELEGYICERRVDGATYTGNPVYSSEPLHAGTGPSRIAVTLDRLLFYDVSGGLRVAYAFRGGGPTARGGTGFSPLLVEARMTYWFGRDPFAEERLRPFVYAAAGLGMFDIHTNVHVREDPTLRSVQGGNDLEQRLDAWKRAGDAFVGIGAGLFVPVSSVQGPSVELGLMQVFPFGATVLSPRAGWRIGF